MPSSIHGPDPVSRAVWPRVLGLLRIGSVAGMLALTCGGLRAELLWSDLEPRVIHDTPVGKDILGGAVSRDDTASDVLYFRLEVDPLSDVGSEEYFALFQLVEDGANRLAMGNAPDAWGYSACYTSETGPYNEVPGEYDLKSAHPEAAGLGEFKPYELPRYNHPCTIVFRVQYVPGADDLVTVWLNPDLGQGATDENQEDALTTRFTANASFNEVRPRHEGGGNGWIFSDMAIATSFADFVIVRFWQRWWFATLSALLVLAFVVLSVRLVEQRKYQRQLQVAEQQRAVESERARIARDLHDELGSSLARISLLSNLVRLDKDQPLEVEAHALKLGQSADQTVRSLEEIVWAVRPGSDSLQGLMDYIAHFADEFSTDAAVRCRLNLPPDLPDRHLAPDLRHNIFLVVKEALTNAVRHSAATEVSVKAEMRGSALEVQVQDNGHGFDPAKADTTHHNGLRNMQRRADTIGGRLEIRSETGKGTWVVLRTPLEKPPPESV